MSRNWPRERGGSSGVRRTEGTRNRKDLLIELTQSRKQEEPVGSLASKETAWSEDPGHGHRFLSVRTGLHYPQGSVSFQGPNSLFLLLLIVNLGSTINMNSKF